MKTNEPTYWQTLRSGIRTSLKGLSLSWRHFKDARQSRTAINVENPNYFHQQTGIVTLSYPHEAISVPDNGRYRLYNEMDDCIVCDKCAKVCPVDCIEIEPIKATEEVGKASDGSSIRLYAARFDIDMAKCCYCGLCTTVCPTECLTMTKTYDYSEFDIRDMIYNFTNLTPEQAEEKQQLYDQFVAEKEALKAAKATAPKPTEEVPKPAAPARPAFKPAFKKPTTEIAEPVPAPLPEPEAILPEIQVEPETLSLSEEKPKPQPVFKPTMKRSPSEEKAPEPEPTPAPLPEPLLEKPAETPVAKPRPVFKPTFKKPAAETSPPLEEPAETPEPAAKAEPTEAPPTPPKPRPVFKPTFKKPASPTPPDSPADPS